MKLRINDRGVPAWSRDCYELRYLEPSCDEDIFYHTDEDKRGFNYNVYISISDNNTGYTPSSLYDTGNNKGGYNQTILAKMYEEAVAKNSLIRLTSSNIKVTSDGKNIIIGKKKYNIENKYLIIYYPTYLVGYTAPLALPSYRNFKYIVFLENGNEYFATPSDVFIYSENRIITDYKSNDYIVYINDITLANWITYFNGYTDFESEEVRASILGNNTNSYECLETTYVAKYFKTSTTTQDLHIQENWFSYIMGFPIKSFAQNTESTIRSAGLVYNIYNDIYYGYGGSELWFTSLVTLNGKPTYAIYEQIEYARDIKDFYYWESVIKDKISSVNSGGLDNVSSIYFKFPLNAELTYYTEDSWIKITITDEESDTSDTIQKIKISASENRTDSQRIGSLLVKLKTSETEFEIYEIEVTLNMHIYDSEEGDNSGDDSGNTDDDNDDDDISGGTNPSDYRNPKDYKIIIDRNDGESYDATTLLYKIGITNSYKTITAKDNTLFLGNYKNLDKKYLAFQVLTDGIADNLIMFMDSGDNKSTLDFVSLNFDLNNNYSYNPVMNSNSRKKRLFKKGENYLLGVVLVFDTGYRSSVFYISPWKNIETDPFVYEDTATGKIGYLRPKKVLKIASSVSTKLSELGVIGILPVYAVNNSHNILCQGFLSPTLASAKRKNDEHIDAQYSWYYREDCGYKNRLYYGGNSAITASGSEISDSDLKYIEVLSFDYRGHDLDNSQTALTALIERYLTWDYNTKIMTLNTPEAEVDDTLTNYMLESCSLRPLYEYDDFTYLNTVSLRVDNVYARSCFASTDIPKSQYACSYTGTAETESINSITDRRFINGYIWYGFVNNGFSNYGDSSEETGDLTNQTSDSGRYSYYRVYPWNRAIIGGESKDSSITLKRFFNMLYSKGTSFAETNSFDADTYSVNKAYIYKDYDTNSILSMTSSLYQGNVDYLLASSELAYSAWCKAFLNTDSLYLCYPRAKSKEVIDNYDEYGRVYDPISITYKAAPHVVIKLTKAPTISNDNNRLYCAELYNEVDYLQEDNLEMYQWIECGDLQAILKDKVTTLTYIEGDYFFGRFDSLRTYPYTSEDTNSIIEVVSGMLCSRVNLDARVDKNRGICATYFNNTNFNVFNPVYNQLNNYITYSYIDYTDFIYKRTFSNSLEWSMTKSYGEETDSWCQIPESSCMDLDGDKGVLEFIVRLDNNLLAFLDKGISVIQYNEKTQISTTLGVPIEVGNSGKVTGKYYIYDTVGCLNSNTISKSTQGLYFIDSYNNTIYKIDSKLQLSDLCLLNGMKSWGLNNLNYDWWSAYDPYAQEVLFINKDTCLAYNDTYQYFNSFLSYENVRWNFSVGSREISINTEGDENTFWLRNSKDKSEFFGSYKNLYLQLLCAPYPTIDKTFTNIDYRADCFDDSNNYVPNCTFTLVQVWNEYQDTGVVNLNSYGIHLSEGNTSINFPSNLKKKFRNWDILIPRAVYKDASSGSKDRIRNPWCNIKLTIDDANEVIFNLKDILVLYYI